MGPVLLTAGPQITTGKATEDRRSSGLCAFTLQRFENFLYSVTHGVALSRLAFRRVVDTRNRRRGAREYPDERRKGARVDFLLSKRLWLLHSYSKSLLKDEFALSVTADLGPTVRAVKSLGRHRAFLSSCHPSRKFRSSPSSSRPPRVDLVPEIRHQPRQTGEDMRHFLGADMLVIALARLIVEPQPRLRVGIYTNSRYPLNVGLEGPLCCP
jgi:hypothetical protein